MFLQPGPYVGMFMCLVIVEDKVHCQSVRDFLLECFQKRQELCVPVLGQTGTDDLSAGDVQRGGVG